MKSNFYLLVFILSVFFFKLGFSQEIIERDVFIVIGQSNAAGRAPIEDVDEGILNNVDLFNGENWVPAENPMNAYSNIFKGLSIQKFNFSHSFSKKINETTGKRVGMIVNARGGTSINQWQKNDEAGYFESSISRITEALNIPGTNLKGILWHQGESDVTNTDYLTSLQKLIQDLRTEIGDESLLFIAGQITQENEAHSSFNENIKKISEYANFTDFVTSEDLTTTDGLHFDSESQRILGQRYADKILELIYTTANNPDHNINDQKGIVIYPVPSKQKLNISSATKITNVVITDMQGKIVISKNGKKKKKARINTSDLKRGNYLIKITTINNNVSSKLFTQN